ncbi:MAG: glycosyltransferase family 2 protein [Acidimicrobiales bacterium]
MNQECGHGPTPHALTASVIICAYTERRWRDVCDAIESLQSQSIPVHQVVLVIDHNDDLLAMARSTFAGRGVDVIANSDLKGLSGARNTGVNACIGDVIAFLDDDASADADWLENLLAAYDDPAVAGVGGNATPVWPTSRPNWFPPEFDWVIGCSYVGLPTERSTVRNFIGCNMSFRREIFDRLGPFANGLGRVDAVPLGCEETEFCIRVKQAMPDAILRLEPASNVNHRVSDDRVKFGYFASRCKAEGLSKAAVSGMVGAGDGLESERAYTLKTLPLAVVRGVALAWRSPAGLLRASAVVAGLALTVYGYAEGKATATRPGA